MFILFNSCCSISISIRRYKIWEKNYKKVSPSVCKVKQLQDEQQKNWLREPIFLHIRASMLLSLFLSHTVIYSFFDNFFFQRRRRRCSLQIWICNIKSKTQLFVFLMYGNKNVCCMWCTLYYKFIDIYVEKFVLWIKWIDEKIFDEDLGMIKTHLIANCGDQAEILNFKSLIS